MWHNNSAICRRGRGGRGQREQELNARLAQDDQEVNEHLAQRHQEYHQFHAQELNRIEVDAARWVEDQKTQLKNIANEFEHHTLEQAEAYIKQRSQQFPPMASQTPPNRPHERISLCPNLGHKNKEEDKKVNAKDYLMWTKKVGIWDKLTTHQGHNVCTKNVAIVNAVNGKSSEVLMLGLGDVDKAINRADFLESIVFRCCTNTGLGMLSHSRTNPSPSAPHTVVEPKPSRNTSPPRRLCMM